MDKSLLMIVGIVFVVVLAGALTVVDFTPVQPDITGNAVAAPDRCDSCDGEPVCAGKDGVASTYSNACAARCDDARVLYNEICEKIPRN